jgi:hypothetical protein
MKLIPLLFFFIISFFLFSTEAQLPLNPQTLWKEIHSKNFTVIFSDPHEELAKKTLPRLELALHFLQKTWTPLERKIPVLIRLDTDLPNGYAAILPYPHIVIFPMAPPLHDSIGEYSDWLFELCLHELIHILTFEQRRGLAKNLFYVFGNILTPNVLLPRWWLEGVAVDGESRYSQAGRMRSLYQQSFMRALVKDSALDSITLQSINEFRVNQWPYGNRPYFYGALLWNTLSKKKGVLFGSEIHRHTGGRVPYLLETPIVEHSSYSSTEEAFHDSKKNLKIQIREQQTHLTQVPLTPLSPVPSRRWLESQNPHLSYDNKKLLFLVRLRDLGKGLILVERDSTEKSFDFNKARSLIGELDDLGAQGSLIPLPDTASASTIQRLSWLPNSTGFIYDLVSPSNRFEMRSDLWLYDLEKRKTLRLTRGQGAREPSISPKGNQVAYVKLNPLGHEMRVLDLKNKTSHTWFSEKGSDAHWPTWFDEETLIVTIKKKSKEELWLLHSSGERKLLPTPCLRNRYSEFKDNQLWVTCDLNGLWNVYKSDFSKKETEPHFTPITHLDTGAFSHSWDSSNKTLWVTQASSQGFQIGSLASPQPLKGLPFIPSLFEKDYPSVTGSSSAIGTSVVTDSSVVTGSSSTIGASVVTDSSVVTEKSSEKSEPTLDSSSSLNLNPNSNLDLSLDATSQPREYSPWGYLLPQYWIPFIFTSDKSTAYMISTGSTDMAHRHAYQGTLLFDQVTKALNYNLSYLNQTQWAPFQVFTMKEVSFLSDPSLLTRNHLTGFSLDLPLWKSPFYQTSVSVISADRQALGSQSNQTELRTRWSYRFLQGSPRYNIPVRGRLASFELSRIQQNKTPFTAHSLHFLGQYFHASPLGYQGVNQWQLRAHYLDTNLLRTNFIQTQSWQIGNSPVGAMMRGYVTGGFFAPRLAILTYEHWLPGMRLDLSTKEVPSYLHQMHLGFVTDHILLDGLAYSHQNQRYQRTKAQDVYSSLGVESVFDFNVAYHFDIKLVLGYYVKLQSKLGPTEESWNLGFRF